ncbi:MAG: phosphohistidine phosphatase SixA [Gammaproteobacteria bacterium RIFCSPHIGHO2_12_FULL_42_13]|nr:MAG: phosphohistidine phosphatase SixA [Gammaproteobacteria bacterium RIFCSPHIGHO2_12_FULL_42_13]
MRLYLARHGESIVKENMHEPSLSEQGKKDILLLATFLKTINIRVSNIFHSGKLRTQQTAELLSTGITCATAIQPIAGLDPSDDVTLMVNEIMKWEYDTLLVGHLPFMSKFVGKLIADNEYKEIMFFYPGSFVCLEQVEDSNWVIEYALHPRLFRL